MREPLGRLSLKENFMKKRALAILMILVLATAGLFAAYTVTPPADVTAQLTAVIGEFMIHGFPNSNTVDMNTVFANSVEINDAFNDTTSPSFFYGYKTNAETGSFDFEMTVGNFDNGGSGTVLIKSVNSTKPYGAPHVASSNVYTIFRYNAISSTDKFDATTITITPFLTTTGSETDINGNVVNAVNAVDGAPNGNYTADISFHVSAS